MVVVDSTRLENRGRGVKKMAKKMPLIVLLVTILFLISVILIAATAIMRRRRKTDDEKTPHHHPLSFHSSSSDNSAARRSSSHADAIAARKGGGGGGSIQSSPSTLALTTTYDDVIRSTIDRKYYTYPKKVRGEGGGKKDQYHDTNLVNPCDPVTVPFVPEQTRLCVQFLKTVLHLAIELGGVAVNGDIKKIQKKNKNTNGQKQEEHEDVSDHHTNSDDGMSDGFSVKVPTVRVRHALCSAGVRGEVSASLQEGMCNTTSRNRWVIAEGGGGGHGGDDDDDKMLHFTIQPMEQKFEQRTMKWKMNITSFPVDGDEIIISAILKVPQALFPTEPFSEVAAFHVDEALEIRRIPPTTLTEVPIQWLSSVTHYHLGRKKKKMKMVPEFLKASNVNTFEEWIDHDFVQFVEKEASGKYRVNATHTYASLQLFMHEVSPVLSSSAGCLKVPYSKANPGWHKWFDPTTPESAIIGGPVPLGSLLALSQLAVFDYIISNNDRSPNKNNFIVGCCPKCHDTPRRPSGLAPTFVHLDHGMAFYASGTHLLHNPFGKGASKIKFCIFYRPLVNQIRKKIIMQLHQGDDDYDPQQSASSSGAKRDNRLLMRRLGIESIPKPARAILSSGLGGMPLRLGVINARLEHCLKSFNESVVLRPSP